MVVKTMGYSSDLSDKDWAIIETLLSSLLDYSGSGRRSKWSNRDFLSGMLYQLKNGCDLPKDYPAYSIVYWHYKKWRDAGIFEKVLQKLHEECRISLKKAPIYEANDD
jgi:transposase